MKLFEQPIFLSYLTRVCSRGIDMRVWQKIMRKAGAGLLYTFCTKKALHPVLTAVISENKILKGANEQV